MRRDTVAVLLGTATLAGGRAVALVFLARSLGPELQGSFSLAVALLALASEFLSVGLEYSLPVVMAGQRNSLHKTLPAMAAVLIATGVVVVPGSLTILLLLFPDLAEPVPAAHGILLLYAATIVANGVYRAVRAHFVGLMEYRQVGLLDGSAGVAWLLLAWIAVGVSYQAVLLSWVLALLLPALFGVVQLLRWTDETPALDRALTRQAATFGIKTLPGTIARGLNRRGLLYLTALVLSPNDVGIYAVVLAIADAFLYLPSALSHLALGRAASGAWGASDSARFFRWLALPGLVAAGLAWLWGPTALGAVFGAAYAEGSTALAILLIASTLHAVGLVRLHILIGQGNAWAPTVAQSAALTVTMGAGMILTPALGIIGAALASLLAYSSFLATLHSRWVVRPTRG